ncbi:ATP synthase [Actinidia chinensis var. chinensis]|uniref:ATP synthase n=1 Tax=Actinidia chinensis var. chinensis TaxID=1590841 RepID=A0A2R6PL75_ACTCC|nr:ATP synthase [Actinidia chinensis var. chinensis]
MRKFDPWPIFFRREWNRNWPFLVGFAITGTIITKMSLGLSEEDAKNSPFVQRHKKGGVYLCICSMMGPRRRVLRIFSILPNWACHGCP